MLNYEDGRPKKWTRNVKKGRQKIQNDTQNDTQKAKNDTQN